MEEKEKIKEKIIDFLLNPHNKDNILGYEILKKIFASQYNKFSLVKRKFEMEELFNEYLEKKLFKEDGFVLNEVIREKIYLQKDNIISYIYMTINNFLRDIHRKLVKEETTKEGEKRFESIYIQDEEDKEVESIHLRIDVAYVVMIEAKEILESIKQDFSEKDLQTLCYMFTGDKSFFKEEISDDNAYQRKSRLKRKLSQYVKERGFSKEGFLYFVNNYLVSEICK